MSNRSRCPRAGPNVHVVPTVVTTVRFVMKDEGSARPLSRPATQAQTIAAAINRARRHRSEVVIHRADGRIRDKDSYGRDPSRSRDRKH